MYKSQNLCEYNNGTVMVGLNEVLEHLNTFLELFVTHYYFIFEAHFNNVVKRHVCPSLKFYKMREAPPRFWLLNPLIFLPSLFLSLHSSNTFWFEVIPSSFGIANPRPNESLPSWNLVSSSCLPLLNLNIYFICTSFLVWEDMWGDNSPLIMSNHISFLYPTHKTSFFHLYISCVFVRVWLTRIGIYAFYFTYIFMFML